MIQKIPHCLLDFLQERCKQSRRARVPEFENISVISILNRLVQLNHILDVLVVELFPLECLELGVEILSLIEG